MKGLLRSIVLGLALQAGAAMAADECDSSAVFDVANAYYPKCEGLYYVLAQSMPVSYTSRLCGDADCYAAMESLRALDTGDCTMFGNTTLVSDILDQCPSGMSSSSREQQAEDDADLCDISALFTVANAHYPSCEGLYYVLAQSMPVNSTSELCGSKDCRQALRELRALGLGDCVVFDSTTLTTDILDQCPTSKVISAAVGSAISLGVLFLVVVVIVATVAIHRARQAKRSLERLEAVDGKLGAEEGAYTTIDLTTTKVNFGQVN